MGEPNLADNIMLDAGHKLDEQATKLAEANERIVDLEYELEQERNRLQRRIDLLESIMVEAVRDLQRYQYHDDLGDLQHEVGMVIDRLQRS